MIPQTTSYSNHNRLSNKPRLIIVSFSVNNSQQNPYSRVFTTKNTNTPGQYPWITKITGGGYSTDDFQGWASRGQMTIEVEDYANLLTQDFSTTILDGLTVTVQLGFIGMPQSQFITYAILQVEKVEPGEGGTTYNIVCRDLGIELNNPIYQTGDDGFPTSSTHTKSPALPTFVWTSALGYVVGDAVEGGGYIQLCISPGISGGSTPSWNTTIGGTTNDGIGILQWMNVGVSNRSPMVLLMDILLNQIGYPITRLNLTQMNYYTTNLFPGMEMIFTLDSSPQAQEFIVTEIFKALFGFGFWNYQGQFTPHFHIGIPDSTPDIDFWDGVDSPSGGLTSGIGATIQSPLPTEQAGDYYTAVSYKLDYNGSDYTSEVVASFGTAEPFDLDRQQVIQAKGLTTPIGGALYAHLVIGGLFQRYGLRPTLLSCDVDWTGILMEPGDLVSVSHPLIKNRLTGKIGLTHELFHTDEMSPNWENGTVQVKGIDIEYLVGGPYEIAPNGTPVWTSGGAASPYMFIASNSTGKYSDGTPGRTIYP